MIRCSLAAAITVFFLLPALSAQNPGCDGFRYKQAVFAAVKKTTVPFATVKNQAGQTLNLSMDVYEPDGDTVALRPVVVLAHGGSFIFGDKGDMKRWCELLARQGYIAASINYRLYPVILLGFPDSSGIMDTAVKAVGDMKAAVRYFRQDAATANQFRADPGHISIGGYSAGAVVALHAGYLDEQDAIPAFIQNLVNNNGGFNGNSGSAANQTYPSDAEAVINMSGGLYRRTWIRSDELPLLSIHGTADQTVPFLSGLAANLAYLEGSGLLHQQALKAGTWSYLKKVPGGGHTDTYDNAQFAPQVDNYWIRVTALLEYLTCRADTMPKITDAPVPPANAIPGAGWNLYPNPVQRGGAIFIHRDGGAAAAPAVLVLYDNSGRAVLRQPISGTAPTTGLSVAGLPAGTYWAKIQGADGSNQELGKGRLVLIL